MPTRANRWIGALVAGLVLGMIAGCSAQPGTSVAGPCTAHPVSEGGCVTLKVGLGYLPSVQFAPFYLAQQQGAYADAGLQVTFENKIDPDLVTLVGQGALDIGVADGTSVIPAVSQGIPIRYVATIYGTYPSIVFAKSTSGIKTAADLEGKKIGIPGKYGSSWIMLQALLESVGLTPDDVTVVEYPDFGQGVAVQQGAVDAATGFANNEPVQIELAGEDVVVLHVDDVVALPGPGLIASTATIDAKRAAVSAFISVTLTAMRQIAADPKVGLEAAFAAVPDLAASSTGRPDIGGTQRDTQAAILAATIATWTRPGGTPQDYGSIDRTGWAASLAYLTKLGLVPNPVKVDDLLRTDLLAKS